MEPIISFRDFGFQYRAQAEPTLRHINLDIYPGEKVLIAGASGSGKSTLMSCINGLIPFSYTGTSTGSLTVDGMEPQKESIFALSKSVQWVLQIRRAVYRPDRRRRYRFLAGKRLCAARRDAGDRSENGGAGQRGGPLGLRAP